VAEGVPFLGVCIGFQLLFDGSEEDPDARGLGIVEGVVRRLRGEVKLPQMQWNRTEQVSGAHSAMFAPFDEPPWFYFVHSYAPVPTGRGCDAVVATCDYGGPVVAAIEQGSCWGTQFHPEKSGRSGLALLEAFARCCTGTVRLS
jgi:glutamine amidotransferase